jgi:dihydrodipicolinate synthase/N-acetylneuraminate lyase
VDAKLLDDADLARQITAAASAGAADAEAELYRRLAPRVSLANLGGVRAVVTTAFLQRLIDEGLSVREYRLAPGGSVECTVTPG